MSHECETSDFLKVAAIGGVLGCIAGLLVAPKEGKALCNDIVNGYNSISEKAQDLSERGQKLLHLRKEEPSFFSKRSTIITGSLIGGVVGIIAALVLAPESGKDLRERLGDSYEDIRSKAEDFIEEVNTRGHDAVDHLDGWKETLTEVVGKLTSNKMRKNYASKLDEILDWASLGIRALEKFQRRR